MKRIYFFYTLLLLFITILIIVFTSNNSALNNQVVINVKDKVDIGCIELYVNNVYDKSYVRCDFKDYTIKNLPNEISSIRLDLGDKKGINFNIENIIFKDENKFYKIIMGSELSSWTADQIKINEYGVTKVIESDPKIYGKVNVNFDGKDTNTNTNIKLYLGIILFLILYIIYRELKNSKNIIQEVINKNINFLLITIFIIVLFSAFPGHTNFDEFYMLTQYYNNNLDGLQPPLHTILWTTLINLFSFDGINIILSVGSILIIQLILYFFCLKKALEMITNKYLKYILLFSLTLLPVSLVSLGHTGKDTQMLIAFFSAFILLKSYENKQNNYILLICIVLIFYGSFVRSNGISGGIVLIYYWVQQVFSHFTNLKYSNYKNIIITLCIATSMIFANSQIMHSTIKNNCCNSMQILMTPIYDLMGMSVRTNKNLVPSLMYTDKYTIDDINKYYNIYDIDWTGLKLGNYKLLPEVSRHWLGKIYENPREYLQHRLAVLTNFFGFYSGVPKYPYFLGFYTNTSIGGSNKEITKIINNYETYKNYLDYQHSLNKYYSIGITLFYRYVIYISLAMLTIFILIRTRLKIPFSTKILMMSGILYSAPFLILANSSHFRYILWSCFAFFLVFIFNIDLLLSKKNEKNI